MVVEPQLTTMDRFEMFHVDASEHINAARWYKTLKVSTRMPYPKVLAKAVMMPPPPITTSVDLACSSSWLAMKALVWTTFIYKAAQRMKSSPALTPF